MKFLLLAAAVAVSACLFSAASVEGAGCHGRVYYGPENNFPVAEGADNLKFVRQVPNGKLFELTIPQPVPMTLPVVHLYGTASQWGTAYGQLLGPNIKAFMEAVWKYMEYEIESQKGIHDLPVWLQEMIADLGLDVALDLTALLSHNYTSPFIFDELHAMCDATGVDYKMALRVHMIAGLTQGKCSMFGAQGAATAPGYDGLLQLRALDWNMDPTAPFRNYSAVTVYHPSDPSQNAFVNVGFQGFLGSLTGMNAKQLGISEIGVSYPDPSFGRESRIGVPFIFLLRDILLLDNTLQDAMNRMTNAKRTCDLILGVGDGKIKQFRGVEYSSSVCNFMNFTDQMPLESWHPRINDITWWAMDWLCPTTSEVMLTQIRKTYGTITPEVAIKSITAPVETGSNHLAYYELAKMQIWFSFSAPTNYEPPVDAYSRQFVHFDVNDLFNEAPPSI